MSTDESSFSSNSFNCFILSSACFLLSICFKYSLEKSSSSNSPLYLSSYNLSILLFISLIFFSKIRISFLTLNLFLIILSFDVFAILVYFSSLKNSLHLFLICSITSLLLFLNYCYVVCIILNVYLLHKCYILNKMLFY